MTDARAILASTPDSLQTIAVPRPGADGVWNGRLALGTRDPEATFEATEEMLGYFARLSATGAFATDIDHVGESRLELAVVSRGQLFDVKLSARHLHPGSWRVMLQLLAHCHAMEPYDSIALIDDPAPSAIPQLQCALALLQPSPPIFDDAKLAPVMAEDGLGDSLSLSVTCSRDISTSALQGLSTLVDDWGSLVYVGGFTPATDQIDAPLLDKPDLVRHGWSAFEVSIRHWSPNSAALAVLVNLLMAMRRELSIESIEVE